jgi:hypothetical protein
LCIFQLLVHQYEIYIIFFVIFVVVVVQNSVKLNIILVLNKTSPWAHMELELDVLGVSGKLVKYVVHLFKRKN